MEKDTIKIINENGEMECKVLFTTHLDDFKKDYVIFVLPNEEISAAVYNKSDDSSEGALSDVETDEEWAQLGEMLDSYFDALESDEE